MTDIKSMRLSLSSTCRFLTVGFVIIITLSVVELLLSKSTISLLYDEQKYHGIPQEFASLNAKPLPPPIKSSLLSSNHNVDSFTDIPIDPHSSIHRDVLHIRHYPYRTRVDVVLRSDARCPRPVLRGRLSGQSLIVLDWEQLEDGGVENAPLASTVSGFYEVPTRGDYYLEIVILFCSSLNVSSREAILSTCMENAETHRITAPSSKISVKMDSPPVAELGYWKPFAGNSHLSDEMSPVFTRVQPTMCRVSLSYTPRCMKAMSLAAFEEYTFHWGEYIPTDQILHNKYPQKETKMYQVCTVGGSQAETTAKYLEQLTDMRGPVKYYKKHYPNGMTPPLVEELSSLCTHVLLSFGEFPAHSAITPSDHRLHVREMLRLFASDPSSEGTNIQYNTNIYVTHSHHSPLSDITGSVCPPKDWVTPSLIDQYNIVLRNLCDTVGVPFLDTKFVSGPMWDTAPDWIHVDEKVAVAEVRYFAVVLGLVEGKNPIRGAGNVAWSREG